MIPDKFLETAQAEYFCNVYEFIGLGEGKELTPRDVCSIKMNHQSVQKWFDNLEIIGQLRVLKFLRKKYEKLQEH